MSGYQTVYRLLLQSNTGQRLWQEIEQKLRDVKVFKVDFVFTVKDKAEIYPKFILSHDMGDFDGQIRLHRLFSYDDIREVIDNHFGQDVKTYNCRRAVLLQGGTIKTKINGEMEQKYQFDFGDYLRHEIDAKLAHNIREANERIRQQIQEIKSSERFQQQKQNALIAKCKDTIVQNLMPWRDLDQKILDEAWQQFLCAAVIED